MRNQTFKTKSVQIRSKIYPPFMKGFTSAFNLFGSSTIYVLKYDDPDADKDVLKSDWKAIGEDMQHAINTEGSK